MMSDSCSWVNPSPYTSFILNDIRISKEIMAVAIRRIKIHTVKTSFWLDSSITMTILSFSTIFFSTFVECIINYEV
jgi:hypothetical protein